MQRNSRCLLLFVQFAFSLSLSFSLPFILSFSISYPQCFKGSEFCDWLLEQSLDDIRSRPDAVQMGQRMLQDGALGIQGSTSSFQVSSIFSTQHPPNRLCLLSFSFSSSLSIAANFVISFPPLLSLSFSISPSTSFSFNASLPNFQFLYPYYGHSYHVLSLSHTHTHSLSLFYTSPL